MTAATEPRQLATPAIEIGGTHATAALIDPRSRQVVEGSRVRVELDSGASAEAVIDRFTEAAMRLHGPHAHRWGVAIPGPFDYQRGIGRYEGVAKFGSLRDVNVRSELADRLSCQPEDLRFVNDANAFAIGEWISGAARGHDRIVGLTLGTGVGSAFLDRGTPVESGPAVPPGGRVDRLSIGGRPLEETFSSRGIEAQYASERLHDIGGASVEQIAARARHGDRIAQRVLEESTEKLSRALAPWLRSFPASLVVVGGAIAQAWDLLAPSFDAGLAGDGEQTQASISVRLTELWEDAGLIGAAHCAIH